MSRYSSRYLPVVSRDESAIEPSSTTVPSWYKDFVENLEKNSVQSQRSLHEEINAIMGNTKSKFSSVEEAVQDLKDRTGLQALLDAKHALAALKEPEEFKQIPEMKIFIDNFVDDHPGTLVESVVHDLLKIDSIRDRLPDRADVSDEVRSYINAKIGDVVKMKSTTTDVNMQIGKVDTTSENAVEDPFAICEPSRS